MLYQRKTLPNTLMGDPAPLPAELVGLSDADLADLSAAMPYAAAEIGYAGQGFFPVPPAPPVINEIEKVDFARLFTQAERMAIDDAKSSNAYIRDYDRLLSWAPKIRLLDPQTQTGVMLLELGGLIAPGRAAQILAGQAP